MEQQNSSTERHPQFQYSSIDEDPPCVTFDNQNIVKCLKELNKTILKKSLKFSLNLKSAETKDGTNKHLDTDSSYCYSSSTSSSICFTENSVKSILRFIKEKRALSNYRSFIQLPSLEQNKSLTGCVDLENKLNKAFVCQFDACCDEECLAGKNLVKTLLENIQNKSLGPNDSDALHVLLEHCQKCKEIACKAAGCTQFSRSSKRSRQDLIQCIYSTEEFVQCDNSTKFLKFTKNCEFKSANDVKNCTKVKLKELPICGESNLMMLNEKYVIVTKCQNAQRQHNYMKECLAVLEKIGSLQCEYIIPINWIILNKNELYFCSKFYVEPLQKKLNYLNQSMIKDIILQLIEAAKYLNERGILFLTWTSNNLLLDRSGIPQLTNFQLGASLTSQINVETTKYLVFPTILPPEFQFNYDCFANADVWGICCLLKELISKVVVHEDLIHMPREQVWKEMIKRGWKCKFQSTSPINHILHYGWTIQPTERSSFEELEKVIRKRFITD